jgi:histidinol-phosphate aminotransferase
MATPLNRRHFLKANTLAALALGMSIPSMANEEGLLRTAGSESGLINLGSNENPYGISPRAKEAILGMLGESNRYQFNVTSLQDFGKKLATYYQVNENQVLVTAGSGDALQILPRYFSKGNLVTATPTFSILPNTAKKIGTKVIEIPLTRDKVHNLSAMQQAITKETALVYICNPANPTSTIVPAQALQDFCKEAAKKAVVVIDEAYLDFVDPPENVSLMRLVDQHPNLIVLRTFSKIHAMAGLRVGFLVGHPATVRALKDNPFRNSQITVSNLSMAAAMASLQDEDHRALCKQKNTAARNYTVEALAKMHIKAILSHTNFLFFPLGNYTDNFAARMLDKNVILRSENYPDGNWARVSVGTLEEMQSFIRIMQTEWKG